MAVPDFQTLMLPLLRLAGDGHDHGLGDTIDALAGQLQLTDDQRNELLPSGRQPRFNNRVGWAITYFKKAGILSAIGRGRFRITDRGKQLLATAPATIDVAFLSNHFPELDEFRGRAATDGANSTPAVYDAEKGRWSLREGVQGQIREKFERLIPDEQIRRAAFELLAYVAEKADEERADAWYLRDTSNSFRVMTGRMLALDVNGSKIRLSVVGPIGEDVRAALSADAEQDTEFKLVPGSVILSFPIASASRALELLKQGVNDFIDLAMVRLRRAVSLEYHVPEGIAYVSEVVGRELPQPEQVLEVPEEEHDDDVADGDGPASRAPHVRGRAPIFEHGQRSIASLVSDIERKVIALPNLQRPFVWEDTKVRDLLDSLFVGFPVGTLVLWHTADEKEARALGAERAELRATTLVIDGQQRLTSLYAVMQGEDVIDKDGSKRKIKIAFRPRDGRFEVADAAIRNDPEFIPNVTELWKSGGRPKSQIRKELMSALSDSGRVVDDLYEAAVERNLEVAQAISDYRFPTVDIRKTAGGRGEEASEEDVSEIFVRINNQGTRLGQADFVLTLLSVFHGELRDRIEARARAMSEDALIPVDTQQLLRVACGVAFGRARMSAVYRFLRGIDPTSGATDAAGRVRRLNQLDAAARQSMESTPWRDFLLRVRHAGFVNPALIASKNAIVNAYTFYVRGRAVGVPKHRLDEVIARWVFGTLLTARYSTSSETVFEEDLQRVASLGEGDVEPFLQALDDALAEDLTGDYWTHSLVSGLDSQRGRAPAALAFRAAQIVLGAKALFSDQLLQNLLSSALEAGRAASEVHHLFPQAWLYGKGVRDRKTVNQVANLADTGWYENSTIGAQSPAKYVPRLRERLAITDEEWGRLCAEHALPVGWESMDYLDFLRERRRRMADIIRVAYRQLGGESDAPVLAPPWFMPGTELVWQRIVETERALRAVVRE